MDASAIILAGGRSSRMGSNKALLKVGEESNIMRVRNRLQKDFSKIILVTNHFEDYRHLNLPMVSDYYPGQGPLAGIHAGLVYSSTPVNLVVACDMPFISSTLSRFLIEQIAEDDMVVPRQDGRLHTLFSVFKKSMVSVIETTLNNNKYRIQDLFSQVKVKIVEEEDMKKAEIDLENSFFNMNTIEDYEQVKKLIEKYDSVPKFKI